MNITSVLAHPNIALVKYWGKRDKELLLPLNSSISMTLSSISTITTIHSAANDSLILNEKRVPADSTQYQEYIASYLKKIRVLYPQVSPIAINSKNDFPTGAGLASSASGFAALAVAINQHFELNLSNKDLSILARLGSGSATRSILGGFNYWLKGTAPNGEDSHIKQIADEYHWPDLQLAIAVTSTDKKLTSSRNGMSNTVANSPIYQTTWLDTIKEDLDKMERAIREKDFSLMGATAEINALKMHATMMATTPPISYFNQGTNLITNKLVTARESGELEAYFTIDAGPQVKVLYLHKDKDKVNKLLGNLPEVKQLIHTAVGPDAKIITKHNED